RAARLVEQPLKLVCVYVIGRYGEGVPGRPRGDGLTGAEYPSQVRHVALYGVCRGGRFVVAPERLDDAVEADGLAGGEREKREECLAPLSGQRRSAGYVDGTEEPDLHPDLP